MCFFKYIKSIYFYIFNNKYTKLNKTNSINTDNFDIETTYIPAVPDNIDDEYEKIFYNN